VPGGGRRRQHAICRASTTKLVRMWSAIDQPTIIREYTSSIAQQCTVPSLVQCSVMSYADVRIMPMRPQECLLMKRFTLEMSA